MLLLLLPYISLFAHHSFLCWLLFIKFNCVLNSTFYAFWMNSFFLLFLSLSLSCSSLLFSSRNPFYSCHHHFHRHHHCCNIHMVPHIPNDWEESAKDRAHTKKTYIKITQTTRNKRRFLALSHSHTHNQSLYKLYTSTSMFRYTYIYTHVYGRKQNFRCVWKIRTSKRRQPSKEERARERENRLMSMLQLNRNHITLLLNLVAIVLGLTPAWFRLYCRCWFRCFSSTLTACFFNFIWITFYIVFVCTESN